MASTPGPWGTTEKSWSDHVEVHPQDNGLFTIARVRGFAMDEARANAKLIAAAPKLLAALKRLHGAVQDNIGYVPSEIIDAAMEARAAITEATT